ncbi:polyphenol oxidase family protein [Isoptericola sp. S6320L]|uniref:polyphenol oxidase family protein n=1 Tax=Isoptericola sp. S6320L TaxID=2926411 RepID=UPI001FF3A3B6|nr:polyphenol oxidase family protein [Isoptericola sp. S6320L]MCK0116604.1 polyphenol oxidase family protein [Isoptericola sp. S6320L]
MTSSATWAQEALLPADLGAGLLRVDLGPGVVAGFTTRHGGVSPAPWSSLDLATSTGDEEARVRRNREQLAGWIGAPVAFATQVHGATVLALGGAERTEWESVTPPLSAGEADALVTAEAGLGLGVLVADCVPVLLVDPVARVAGVAHAGRRGLVAGVVDRAVDAMVARGASRDGLRAAVGPAVCGACYEVPEALRDEVTAVVPEAWATTASGTPALDLPAGVLARLSAMGVPADRVERCTRTDPDLFSHRQATAAGEVTGRQAGVIVLA